MVNIEILQKKHIVVLDKVGQDLEKIFILHLR